jgi:hypothetical protein
VPTSSRVWASASRRILRSDTSSRLLARIQRSARALPASELWKMGYKKCNA